VVIATVPFGSIQKFPSRFSCSLISLAFSESFALSTPASFVGDFIDQLKKPLHYKVHSFALKSSTFCARVALALGLTENGAVWILIAIRSFSQVTNLSIAAFQKWA
jgi:hypothetical protein